MQEAIIKLKLLGQMPDAVKDDPTVETINMYDELLSNVKLNLKKLSEEEKKWLKKIAQKSDLLKNPNPQRGRK